MTPRSTWPQIAVALLLEIGRRSDIERAIEYAPGVWLDRKPTAKFRQRWSRWTRRLAHAGLIERLTETRRDRVTHVRLTKDGRIWILRNCGAGALEEIPCEFLNIEIPN